MNRHRMLSLAGLTSAATAAALLASTLLAGPAAAAVGPAPAVTAAVSGTLSVTNPDVLPSNSSVIFNKIQNPADTSQRFHNKVSLRLKNTGTNALTVSSLTTTANYTVTSPWKIPFTLTSGNYVDVVVEFVATTGTWVTGTLSIGSTSSTGTASIKLSGWWQKYSEHNLEPRAQDLASYFGYKTVMPSSMYSRGAYQAFSSDEVLSPYWTRINTAAPAKLTEIAAWHGYPSQPLVKTFPKGASTSLTTVFAGLKNDSQSALPRNSSWARGTSTYSPSGVFGYRLDNEYSDAKLNSQTTDRSAGCTATLCGQHVRVFAVRNAAGAIVTGSYLLYQDIGGINYDYNDNVYLIENVKPA